jgi:hypothetical protein
MATFRVSSVAELYAVCGYWDDVAGQRVAGSGRAGDKIVCDFTGTVDRGASNNILYPPAGVWITGPGRTDLTLQGRLYVGGNGGVSVVTRVDNLTVDIKGYPAIPVAVAGYAYGGVVFKHASAVCRRLGITNSNPVAGGNNLTMAHVSGAVPAVRVVLDECVSSSAEKDGFSTQGANVAGSLAYLLNCSSTTPGVATNDQAATCHQKFAMVLVGGTYSGGVSKVALAADNNATPFEAYNATLTGKVSGLDVVRGCVIDGNGCSGSVVDGALSEVSHTRITGNTNGLSYPSISVAAVAACLIEQVDCSASDRNTALLVAAPMNGALTVRNLICGSLMRIGIDAQNVVSADVRNCLLNCTGTYAPRNAIVAGTGTWVTAGNVYDKDYSGLVPDATDVKRAISAEDLATARAAVQTLTRPAPDILGVQAGLLSGGGWLRKKTTRTLMLVGG